GVDEDLAVVEAALGRQRERPVDVRAARGQEQRARRALIYPPLVHLRRAVLDEGGLGRIERAGAAAVLLLVAAEEGEVAAQRLRERGLRLGADVFERRLVGYAGERLDVDVGTAVRAPAPQPIADQRPAQLTAVVGVLVDAVALA